MLNLPEEQKTFLEDESNWHGGPIFELNFVFDSDCDLKDIDSAVREFPYLHPNRDTEGEHYYRSVLEVGPNSYVGIQTYFSKSYYDLGIRPRQFKQFVNVEPGDDLSGCDKERLRMLVRTLVKIINYLKSSKPLRYATISDETQGYINPRCKDAPEGIYIHKGICTELAIKSTQKSDYSELLHFAFNECEP